MDRDFQQRTPQQAETEPPKSRRALGVFGDVVATIAQGVLLFLGFMWILTLSFPEGTGLSDLYGDFVGRDQRDSVVLGLEDGEPIPFVAVLSDVRRHVKERSANAVAWTSANVGLPVADEHAVQTLTRSAAAIRFDDTAELRLDQNSLVIVKRPERRAARHRMASLVVLGGEVRGRIDATAGRSLGILTAGVSGDMRAVGAAGADFTVRSNSDKSSTIAVTTGAGEISADGKTIAVPEEHAIRVYPDGVIEGPSPMPSSPELLAPDDQVTVPYGKISPKVLFRWDASRNADNYRLLIARDTNFEEVVFSEVLGEQELAQGNLQDGTYYWRVVALNGPAESPASPIRALHIEQDVDGPTLNVALPQGILRSKVLELRGTTEPGARLFVDDQEVQLSSTGEFQLTLNLELGPNLVVLEAIDAVGNVTYVAEYVNAKF